MCLTERFQSESEYSGIGEYRVGGGGRENENIVIPTHQGPTLVIYYPFTR